MAERMTEVNAVAWSLHWEDDWNWLTDQLTGFLAGRLMVRNNGTEPITLSGPPSLHRIWPDGSLVQAINFHNLDMQAATVLGPGESAVARVLWSAWSGEEFDGRFHVACDTHHVVVLATGVEHPAEQRLTDRFTATRFQLGETFEWGPQQFEVDPNETPQQQHEALVHTVGDADIVLRRVLDLLEKRQYAEAKMMVSGAVYSRDRFGMTLRRYRRHPTPHK
jgi:hypothetical protein